MVLNIIKKGLDIGSEAHNDHFLSFCIKCNLFTLPGIVLGLIIDKLVSKLQKRKTFGDKISPYVFFQTIVNIIVLYVMLKTISKYANELQQTIPGMLWSALFFSVQQKWFTNIQDMI